MQRKNFGCDINVEVQSSFDLAVAACQFKISVRQAGACEGVGDGDAFGEVETDSFVDLAAAASEKTSLLLRW